MLITIAAIGKLKAGPERELFERYLKRAESSGRSLGLAFGVREFSENRAAATLLRKAQEGASLRTSAPAGAVIVVLDEHGKSLSSHEFADRIRIWRDSGQANLVLALGGPDGHAPDILAAASLKIALGAMTWPHQLARIMLAEQLYRAVTILSGHPYHRA